MDKDLKAKNTVTRMVETDQFSRWLGIEVIDIRHGYSKIQMKIRPEMLNSFGTAHGGVAFSMADTAFAYACNSDGNITVALDVSISFPKAVLENDVLVAEAKALSMTRRTGLYIIEVRNQQEELVALFKGTCYKTEKQLP